MIAVVGDSLAVGTQPYLHYRTDARVGRRLAEGVRIILHEQPRVLVVSLGTNDTPETMRPWLRRVIKHRGGRCTVWPTIFRRGLNYELANRQLRQARAVISVPWAREAHDHPALMGPDGVHPTMHGYRVRARMISHAITRC